MKIQKFNPKSPLTGQIGVVQPSNAAVRSAQQQQQTASQLGQTVFKMAVQEQQDVGREYAVNLVTRDEKTGQINYQEIPDAMSPTARRTAQPLIDTKYQNSLKAAMLAQGKLKRTSEDGSPVNGKVYTESMESYIAETAKLNPRYAGFINEVGGAVAAQHATDIQIKSYEATMALDKRNKQNYFVDEAIPALRATSASSSGDTPSFDTDADGVGDTIADELYKNVIADIDNFAVEHKLDTEAYNKLTQEAKMARYGGQIDRMSAIVSVVAQDQNPDNPFNAESAYLNAMTSALRNPESIASQPQAMQEELAEIGFTREFLQQNDMQGVRSKLATNLSAYQGTRQEEAVNNANLIRQQQTEYDLGVGAVLSQKQADNYLEQVMGIQDGYDLLNNLDQIMSDTNGSAYKIIMGRGPLPAPVVEMFTDQGIIDLVGSQKQLTKFLELYRNVTNDGASSMSRGMTQQAITKMEELNAYSGSIQTMSLEQFQVRRNKFNALSDTVRADQLKAVLGNEQTLGQFVRQHLNLDDDATGQEIAHFMKQTPMLLYVHGEEKTKKILQQSADRVFAESSFIYSREGDSTRGLYSPETRYGDYFNTFRTSVDLKLAAVDENFALGRTHSLVATGQGGPSLPVYLVVDKTSGEPAMFNGAPMMVGGNSVRAQMQSDFLTRRNEQRAILRDAELRLNERRATSFKPMPFSGQSVGSKFRSSQEQQKQNAQQ